MACRDREPGARHEQAGSEQVRIFKKAAACAVVAMAVGSMLPVQASISHPAVVSENPADTTPHIVFDAPSQDVRAYAQVGRTMYAGGRFNQVQDWARTTTYARQNFVAFDRETGVVSPLDLAFNGTRRRHRGKRRQDRAVHLGLLLAGQRHHPPGTGQVRPGQQPDRPDLPAGEPANGVRPRAGQRCGHRGGELRQACGGAGPDDRRGHRRHRHHRRRGGRLVRRDQGPTHRGLPGRHPVGGHGQLRHGQRPGPPSGPSC